MLLVPVTSGLAQAGFLTPDLRIKKLVSPVYLDNELQPVAVIRVDHVFSDFQRKGFFRIGVLPVFVLDGLSLELCDTTRLSAVLTNVSGSLSVKRGATRVVEGRDFSLFFSAQKNAGIRARTVRLQSGTDWRLQDGTILRADGSTIPFRHATLKVVGPNSGELTSDSEDGPIDIRLVSLLADKVH